MAFDFEDEVARLETLLRVDCHRALSPVMCAFAAGESGAICEIWAMLSDRSRGTMNPTLIRTIASTSS